MKELSLEEIKCLQVDLLKHFDAFCQAHGIRYFLCNGTLLGAVKYKGYIPWDDDIDVCLPREDYDRLIREYTDPTESYELLSFETNPAFLFPFAKFANKKTKLIEANAKDSIYGVNLDVFPLDSFGQDAGQIQETFNRFQKMRRKLNGAKLKNYVSNNIVKCVGKFVLTLRYKLFGAKRYCRKMIEEAKAIRGDYIGDVVWGFYGCGEAFHRSVFEETIFVEFEGKAYPAPKKYDEYLTGLYGDWRSDPPLEKQTTHHVYHAYLK